MERGENMASALWGKFASEVLKEVGFKYDHNAIRQELVEHMEELYEDLQAEGMDGLCGRGHGGRIYGGCCRD